MTWGFCCNRLGDLMSSGFTSVTHGDPRLDNFYFDGE